MIARRLIGTNSAPTIAQAQDAQFDLASLRAKSA
jgi:hypothetical protein